MTLDLALLPVTFARLEWVCLLLGLDPDALVQGAPQQVTINEGNALPVLQAVCGPAAADQAGDVLVHTARMAAALFFEEVAQQHTRAQARAVWYAQQTGVADMGLRSSGHTSLGRMLARYNPSDYHALTEVMTLEAMLTYILKAGINHITDHPDEHLDV
jgi:hypothetical protein